MKIKEINRSFTWMGSNPSFRSGTGNNVKQRQDVSKEGILIFPQHKTRSNDISVLECYHYK